MKNILLFALTALLLTACLPQDTQIPQSPLLPFLERKSGLIAYIGTDGNLYVSDQAGNNLTQLTEDAVFAQNEGDPFRYYQFPAWSKDGNQLAFVGLDIEGSTTEATMFIHSLEQSTTTEVYSSRTEYPFYLNWSPDHASIGFITTTAQQNSIILKRVSAAGGESQILDTGSPYYWSWAPDGTTLIVHTGSDRTTPPRFAFLRVDTDVKEYALDFTPASFQAPAWSPDGSRIALTRAGQESNEIIVTDGSGANPQIVGKFTAKTAFAWSFDSSKLAYITAETALSDGTIGALHVRDLETDGETVVDDDILAFFWSRDSHEVAYFILLPFTPEEGSSDTTTQYALQLKILDVRTGESRDVSTFLPTEQFLNILPYFDQYHQSATIWSPDDNNLVLSFLTSQGAPAIAIVPSSGTMEPRLLAPGFIAFWSWE